MQKKLNEYDVVDVDTIERGVHLIPCYRGLGTSFRSRALNLNIERVLTNQVDGLAYNSIY